MVQATALGPSEPLAVVPGHKGKHYILYFDCDGDYEATVQMGHSGRFVNLYHPGGERPVVISSDGLQYANVLGGQSYRMVVSRIGDKPVRMTVSET